MFVLCCFKAVCCRVEAICCYGRAAVLRMCLVHTEIQLARLLFNMCGPGLATITVQRSRVGSVLAPALLRFTQQTENDLQQLEMNP